MSNFELIEGQKVPIKAWIKGVQVEEKAKQQLINLSSMPFLYKHIACMPDVHWGMGATVGSVIATKGAIIPAAVGVDIGCGMIAYRINLTANDLPDDLSKIRHAIEAACPHGRTNNGQEGDRGAWHNIPEDVVTTFTSFDGLYTRLKKITDKHPYLERSSKRAPNHFGTLGTGNHFIEICLDEENNVWIMLHSGSRGIGNAIGTYFIEKAKEEMKRWFINLPDVDLAYLSEGSSLCDDYIEAVSWAQDYARENRERMVRATIDVLSKVLSRPVVVDSLKAINCHHNYVQKEHHFGQNVFLTRKGAVRAREGDLGIIPGSMGVKSFIVKGKGNPDSFHSCSHGAGRKMSRTQAKKEFTVEDHIKATMGVECRKDKDVIDETPMAYKDIDAVMNAQSDLVEIVHTLKQVVCVKG